jgi:hypothetical protein
MRRLIKGNLEFAASMLRDLEACRVVQLHQLHDLRQPVKTALATRSPDLVVIHVGSHPKDPGHLVELN